MPLILEEVFFTRMDGIDRGIIDCDKKSLDD